MPCNCCSHIVRHIKESRPSQKQSNVTELNLAQHVFKSPMNDIILPKAKFLDRLWRDYSNFSNHVAIECVISKKSYTYQQLRKNMAVFASSLRNKLGLKSGDVVGAMLPNCPQFPVVALGAIQAGCIVSFPVNPLSNDGELQEIVPYVLPFTHIYGFMPILIAHLAKGCKLLSVPKFCPALYLEVLKNHKPTVLYVVPPIASMLAKHPEVNADLLRSVRHIICGAAPICASDADAIMKKTKGYGATETCAVACLNLLGAKLMDYSTCGVPMANVRIKFISLLTGETVPIGEPGELCVKSPAVMKRYHKNTEATTKAFTIDGYFKTGDLAYYKPDEGLFIIGRINDLIKVKGMHVVPRELESILCTHPAVQDAAVVGVPGGINGESIKAFIVRNDQDLSADEAIRFVIDKVENYKQINEVVFIAAIPKTNAGKILRRQLKAIS